MSQLNWRNLTAGLLALWLVLPMIPLAIWSVAHGWRFPALLPLEWSGAAWAYALSGASGVGQSIGVTFWIAFCATLLSVLLGVPAGRALGLYQFRGKALVELILLAPIIVPGIAVGLGLQTVFIGLGLTGSVTGVVIVHLIPALPYMTLVMAGVFAGFDMEVEAQASSLGASRWQIWWHVTLPAVLPGIITGALFCFLVSWSQYILTLLIGGGRVITLPLLLFNFAGAGRNDITGAIALIYILPGLVVLAFTARAITGRNPALVGGGM
jgi:putative spermidine/putrescine transport system permease protein